MRTKKVGLVLLLVSGVTAGAHAQGPGESIVIMPHDIVWKAPPVSPGPETAEPMVTHRSPASTSCA
jgi:hypothetical protein